MKKTKIVSASWLFIALMALSIQNSNALKLSINNSRDIDISSNVNYYVPDGSVMIKADEPIICHTTFGPFNANLVAEIVDPNGNGTFLPVLGSMAYNFDEQVINTDLNNSDAACVVGGGNSFGDVIFRDGLDKRQVRYEGLSSQVIRGEAVDYKIIIENVTDEVMEFDMIEYVTSPSVNNPAAFFESVDLWNCVNHNQGGVDCNEDNEYNVLLNASVPVNGMVEMDVTRSVGSNSLLGQSIEMMTAVFEKNGQGELVNAYVISNQVSVVDNSAPVISWADDAPLAFVEDDTLAQQVIFNVFDNTGINLDSNYLATVVNDVNNKLDISNFNINQVQAGQYEVSFEVTPVENQFTSSNNVEQIFVQIEDQFGVSSNLLTLPVTIAPINDAPGFNVTCLDFTINPSPVAEQSVITCNQFNGNISGPNGTVNWTYSDFITDITAGGLGNNTELGQHVIFETLPVSGIITQGTVDISIDPGTFIINDLILGIPDGVYGEGRFRVRALDDGTPQGENDVCPALSPADHCSVSEYSPEIVINLLEPVYYISGTIDDLPGNDEMGLRLYEAGTNIGLGGTMLIAGLGANGGEEIKFTFPEALNDGQAYDVRITLDPFSRTCSITSGGTGIISGNNVSDVVVECNPIP